MEVKLEERDIQDVYRIGYKKERRDRPTVIRLNSIQKKYQIMRNARKLKDTSYSVSEQFSKKTIEERKQLVPYLKKIKDSGATAFIRHNYIIVDNKKMFLTEIKQKIGDSEKPISSQQQQNSSSSSKNYRLRSGIRS
ncbi:uncharacterized protein LOC126891297 [Diabrotica virgifera virgifera]|uniref:Uncharacterized protein n=1 Tax=Diabrotica virgifera virgifera TaxID=50390 RepID=A0ABM5L1X0_DIAVI|nr:uncharacterized protein LOC126891297 [Diabrotica virgifera virgifera]